MRLLPFWRKFLKEVAAAKGGKFHEMYSAPMVRQIQDKWRILKPDGTPESSTFDSYVEAIDEITRRMTCAEAAVKITEIVKKVAGKGWCVLSHDETRSFGCYTSEQEAKNRLQQLGYFKRAKAGIEAVAPAPMAQDPMAVCGALWTSGSDEERMSVGDPQGVTPDQPPPQAWLDACVAKATEHMAATEGSPFKRSTEALSPYNVARAIVSGLPHRSIIASFKETGPKDATGKVWDVVLIEEGESKNGRTYSRETLKSAFDRKVFEGVPGFGFVYRTPDGLIIDHAKDGVDTSQFPKDVAGFHKNIRFEETTDEHGNPSGKMGLVGEWHFMDEVLQKKAMEAYAAGNPGLFGFSIDAIGEGDELAPGKIDIKYIVRANSDDLVSYPAAGGRFIRMVASLSRASKILKEGGSMNKKAILLALIAEMNPKLLEGKKPEEWLESDLRKMVEAKEFDPVREMLTAILAEKPIVGAPAVPALATAAALETEKLLNEARKIREGTEKDAKDIRDLAESMKKDRHNGAVEASIREAGLPEEGAKLVRDLAITKINDAAFLKECISRAQKLLEAGGWTDPKITEIKVGDVTRDRFKHAIEGAMSGRPVKSVPPFKSLRQAIGIMTGQYELTSRRMLEAATMVMQAVIAKWNEHRDVRNVGAFAKFRESAMAFGTRKYGLKEAINLAQFAEIFGDSITRMMIADYELPQLNDWRAICSKIGFVDDTRVQRRDRLGQYPDLSTVAEGDPYTAIASLTDEEVTLSVTKYGNFEELTEEAILRNDLEWFAKIPQRLQRSALQNVRKKVWNLVLGNGAIYDGVVLFHLASHANTDANALSVANLNVGRARMRKQLAYGSAFNELGLGNLPTFLLVPPELENVANEISSSQYEPTASLFQVANLHKGLKVIVLDHNTAPTKWHLVADPGKTPTIECDFVGDSDAPELFTQDDPNVGTPFDSDEIRVKVRIWHGEAVLDYRGFYGANV